jgi:stringent starvation protein B
MADALTSTKPYMMRAIHEWCMDNGMTPHLLVVVNVQTKVPRAFVKDGEIVLNLSYSATKDLHIENDAVTFSARFGGASQNLYVPMDAVRGIFARENGQGMFFELDSQGKPASSGQASSEGGTDGEPVEVKAKAGKKRPTLTVVK